MLKQLCFSKNARGVTLVELMISLSILVVIVILWMAMTKNSDYYFKLTSQSINQDKAKSTLNLMSREIRGAKKILAADVNPMPHSLTFQPLKGGRVFYYLKQVTFSPDPVTYELKRDSSKKINYPLQPPIETITVLKDVADVSYRLDGIKITIDLILVSPFVANAAKKTFTVEVCPRNP